MSPRLRQKNKHRFGLRAAVSAAASAPPGHPANSADPLLPKSDPVPPPPRRRRTCSYRVAQKLMSRRAARCSKDRHRETLLTLATHRMQKLTSDASLAKLWRVLAQLIQRPLQGPLRGAPSLTIAFAPRTSLHLGTACVRNDPHRASASSHSQATRPQEASLSHQQSWPTGVSFCGQSAYCARPCQSSPSQTARRLARTSDPSPTEAGPPTTTPSPQTARGPVSPSTQLAPNQEAL